MDILIGLISGLFWPVLIVVGIVWFVKRLSRSPSSDHVVRDQSAGFTPATSTGESSIRHKIAAEIRAQLGQYKTDTQKKVVEDMAQTVEYFADHGYQETTPEAAQATPASDFAPAGSASTMQVGVSASETVSNNYTVSEQPYETPWKKLSSLDGATILLYLGAFFVLASIGLYVGLGQGDGLKAALVTLITAIFYCGGIALYKNSTRLKPAGMTFVAIGMATLPMAGAAMYYFALNEKHGPIVWLGTSMLAIMLYAHAMHVLRSALVSYMVVFSTLSVVLASISSLGIAPYYFIQGMGFAGVFFAICSKLFGSKDNELSDAYDKSAMFMVPFSVGLAVLFASKVGWIQLAFSLLLGGVYYTYAAMQTTRSRSAYVLLAQLMSVAALLTAGYGVSKSAVVVAVLTSVVSGVYTLTWLLWARLRESKDAYRQQIKQLTFWLPFIAVIALTLNLHIIWIAATLVLVTSLAIYIVDHDWQSGLGWLTSILCIPLVVSYYTLETTPTISIVGLVYLAIGALAVLAKYIFGSKCTSTDNVFQVMLLYISQVMAGLMQFGADNNTQVFVMAAQAGLLTLQAVVSSDKKYAVMISALVQVLWLGSMLDDAKYLFWAVVGVLVFNLVLAQVKTTSTLHDWLVLGSALVAPLIWGIAVVSPDWDIRSFWYSYTGLFVVLFGLRYIRKALVTHVAITGYITTLFTVFVLGFYVSPWFGFIGSIAVFAVLLVSEKLEKASSLGYIAPLMPLGLLFHIDRSPRQALLSLLTVLFITVCLTLWRRRRYEAYVGMVLSIISLLFAGTVAYDWSGSAMMWLFMAMSAGYIALRFALKTHTQNFADVLMVGYSASLVVALIYCLTADWQIMSTGLFVIGLLVTAISYLESAPAVIILSFMAGYGSILRYADGNKLSLNATIGILIGLSQGVYWILVLSKLDTVRAKYARYFQIVVGGILPMIGLGYVDRPIFPASLTFFSLMLTREIWSKGQAAKEAALFMVHLSGLWWLYALGVRELQVFTQATAAVVAGFAYWRRKIQDSPSVINQYLWTAVLLFTIPMAYQALAYGDPKYSYLLLVEHVLLIVVSIGLKRATFAWWGIAVTVAAVLYQLRRLRYAALAFLGAFIISLAVYFLLRYNKPEEPKK